MIRLELEIDEEQLAVLADKIGSCKKIVLMGAGKSYLAALVSTKIANSYGLKWYCIDAYNSLHGDLGIVSPHDLIVAISKSGETRELIQAIRLLDGNEVVSLTFSDNANNRLADLSSINLNIPVDEQAPHDCAPLNSSVLTQVVLNEVIRRLASSVHEESYKNNHAGGAIGEKFV